MRIRCADRRAQCRQIDADQRAGRQQGCDRVAQGTDDALLRGIAVAGRSQLVFVDTPGIFAPKRRLDRAMVTHAWAGAHDADIVGVLLDAGADRRRDGSDPCSPDRGRPAQNFIINKIDLVEKSALLAVAKGANERLAFAATFMISALTGDGVADVKSWLAVHVPEGPWHYPEDQITDAPLRQLAAEVTAREALFAPASGSYKSTVETDTWTERKDGSIGSSRRSMSSAKASARSCSASGQTIKAIGAEARREIAAMVEAPVHLFLFVKVREGWGEDPERYRELGLEFPRE